MAGVGAAKTSAALFKCISYGQDNPDVPILLVEPTFNMQRDILLPAVEKVFTDIIRVGYHLNKSDWNIQMRLGGGTTELRLRSGDHPQRIDGQEVGLAIVDEAGQHKDELLQRIPRRVRHTKANYLQRVYQGTPEGFNEFYERAEGKKSTGKGRRLLRARTEDNPFLPPGYIEDLLSDLSPEQRRQYMDGLFIPLGGAVYAQFDRKRHLKRCKNPTDGTPVMFCDFNVGKRMHWAVGRKLGDEVHIWSELTGQDNNTTTESHTQRALEFWDELEVDPATVMVICDATGKDRRTSQGTAGTDVQILRRAGFDVRHKSRNPPIKDRVNTVNHWLHKRRLFFDPEGCPLTWKAIEGQGYASDGAPDKSGGFDDACDAVGYGCWMLGPVRAPAGNRGTYL